MGKSIWLCTEWLQVLPNLSVWGEYNSTSVALGSDSPADFGGDLGQSLSKWCLPCRVIVRIQCICRYMHSLSHVNILRPLPPKKPGTLGAQEVVWLPLPTAPSPGQHQDDSILVAFAHSALFFCHFDAISDLVLTSLLSAPDSLGPVCQWGSCQRSYLRKQDPALFACVSVVGECWLCYCI